MYSIDINDQNYYVDGNMNLLDFLRDIVHITSLKNGCGEGSCGACMILVDGKAMRACLLTLAKVSGKKLLTVEGLSPGEKETYTWAFAEAGAVQCGFCIPGMIISAKELLDQKPNPTLKEVKEAIRGNICRCTGYAKIEEGILLAAKVLRREQEATSPNNFGGIGKCLNRVDVRPKVLGTAQFVDDIMMDGMLYGATLRTKVPRALIKRIDTSKAISYPGVEAVLTAEDIPGENYWGHIFHDWPTLVAVGEETRYIGDALALVAAQSKHQAHEALALIKVEYEELEPVISPSQALLEQAAKIHPNGNLLSKTEIRRGDVEEAIRQSAFVVSNRYTTPPTDHAFMEPECALAIPNSDGGITVYVSSQSVYDDMHGIAAILNLPQEKVRVVSQYVGGAFGGKEDLSVQHHSALLALKTKKPVKLTFSRQESLLVHPKRHAMEIELTTACDDKGRITAIKAKIIADTGAYASLGSAVLQRTCTHIGGPYHVPNAEITGLCVYTNNPPAGAFRGFGVPQASFAGETNLDLLAEKVGISPWEIRFLNALESGLTMATGQIADEGTALKETLLAVRKDYEAFPYTGIASTLKNTGIGVGLPDIARVRIEVKQGRIIVFTSAQCIGQGLATIITQVVHETSGVGIELIDVANPDTFLTPNAGTTTASRQTLFTGEAARQATLKLREALKTTSLKTLEGQKYYGEYYGKTDPLTSEIEHPLNHVAFSYATHVVILNEEGKIQKVIAAHDVGRAINPKALEGQIEGGIAMGLGYALRENFPLEKGIPKIRYASLGLFRSTDMPEMEVRIIEKITSLLAYGAKGIGEIATIPVAPAVASAYYKWDRKLRLSLPLSNTPYRKN
jgi:selenium-dependent xanthine dehydrogenase